MDIAAIIMGTLSLIAVVPLWALFLGKNYFSTHVVQMVAADSLEAINKPGRPMTEPFKEIGEALSDDELEYFKSKEQA